MARPDVRPPRRPPRPGDWIAVPPVTTELVTFCLYLLAGPLAWVVYAVAIHAGRRKMLLLRRPPIPPTNPPATPPGVTIMIPAKDEGERIRACIESALAQDYPNFDVIA